MELLAKQSVADAADSLGLSSRHLCRLLIRHSGLGPKEHQRVMRLRRFLDSTAPLAYSAVAIGYSDQPYLTREVTRLRGISPGQLRAERRV